MSYCKLLKHGITIDPDGSILPCCFFYKKDYPKFRFEDDWYTTHLDLYEKSKHGWLDACHGCKTTEDRDGKSYRVTHNKTLANAKPDEGILYWDLKINNTCNLACRICNASSSSTWEQIAKMPEAQGLGQHYINLRDRKWHKEVGDITQHLSNAQVVKFTGGEPMMIPQVKRTIDFMIDAGIAKDIELTLTTNGTWDLSPYYDKFKQFKDIIVIVSVDGVGPLFNYLRQNADWDFVYPNILDIKNNLGKVHCLCTPQALNNHLLDDIRDFFAKDGIYVIFNQPVYSPVWMKPDALDIPELRRKFVEQMTILDQIHGTDYREFLP
jgi:MoaA/NifB/PqqE/SkfB family radical SAM enzyme